MLPIGSRLADRYTVEALLGAGGMGEVYVAFDLRLERRVALKVLVPQAAYSEQTLADWTVRMMREARAAASFTHPNVVGIHDVGVHDGQPYLALELVKGASLRSFIGKDVPLARKVSWLVDIAHGLGAAHRAGVIHRDVKPDNVLISDDGPAKVLDFGIARRLESEGQAIDPSAPTEAGQTPIATAPGTLLGTPSYMAPEQLHGEQVDGRTDQFSWGVLAFEVLSGHLPWRATDTIGTIAAILTRAPQALPDELPGVLREVVLRALSRGKEDRFPTMDRVADVLRRFLDQQPEEPDEADEAPLAEDARLAVGEAAPARLTGGAEASDEGSGPSAKAKTEGTPPPFATTLPSPTPPPPLRRRTDTARPVVFSLLAVLLAGAGGVYLRWRAAKPAVSFCAEIGQKRGAPACLAPLDAATAARRGESFRVTSVGGKITRVESVNGRGTRMEDSRDRDIVVRDYRYLEDGTLAEMVASDLLGRFRRRLLYSDAGKQADAVDLEGRPLGLRGTGVTRVLTLESAAGYVSHETFHARSGAPRADAGGAYGHLFEHDAQGRETRLTHLGADGLPITTAAGFVSERYVPSPWGGAAEIARFDAAGQPAHERGAHLTKREYDAYGNVTLVTTFSTDGQKAAPVGEAAVSTSFVYDAAGNLTELRYRGKDGAPVRSSRGFAAGFRFGYDEKGRRTEERHQDPDGNLMRSAWGASIFRYTFDAVTGALIEEAGFDAKDAPTVYTFGCARRRIEQLVLPRSWSVRCFDGTGAPTRDTGGVHWQRYDADPSGRVTGWSSTDAAGALAINRELEARVRWKYDASGNEIERAAFGADERPTDNAQGYARRRQLFDGDGNVLETAYLDSAGAPAVHRDGFATTRFKVDVRGLRVEQTWLDAQGNGVMRAGGYAGERFVYDRQGRLVQTAAVGPDGNLVRRAGGYAATRLVRDGAGRIAAETFVDEKGAPVVGDEGYAVERTTYDLRGLPLSYAYEDAAEKPVLRRGGYASHEVTYDERGNVVSQRWLDTSEKPVAGPDGAATVQLRYDDADRVISVRYVGKSEEPVAGREGYASRESRYDEDGNEVETTYLDQARKPIAPVGKTYATVRRTYDARRNNLELSTFDARGGPVLGDSGAATSRFNYDALGRSVSIKTFDTRGLPVAGAEGAPVVTVVYDDLGNVSERTFRDAEGGAMAGRDGFATRRARYDARGRTTEESFHDASGKPVLSRAGVSKRRFVFDLRGNLLEIVSLGLVDEPAQEADDVSTERRAYDDRSRMVEILRFNLAGKPTAGRECARVVVRYDAGPAESSRECYDATGRVVPGGHKKPAGAR